MKIKLDRKNFLLIVKQALEEDIGEGDITTENITNISNQIRNDCGTYASNTIENITFVATQSTLGDVSIVNKANVNSYCMIDNLAKIQSELENKQGLDLLNGGRKGLFITILIIVGIVIFIVIVIAILGGFISKKKACAPIPAQCTGKKGEKLGECLAANPPPGKKSYCPVPESLAKPQVPSSSKSKPQAPSSSKAKSKLSSKPQPSKTG